MRYLGTQEFLIEARTLLTLYPKVQSSEIQRTESDMTKKMKSESWLPWPSTPLSLETRAAELALPVAGNLG